MQLLKAAILWLTGSLLLTTPALARPVVIKFSHVVAINTPKGQAAEYFKKLVEERSNGDIRVEIYPNSTLFNDKEVMTPLMTNAVQMAAPSFAKFTKFAPELQLVDLPFLFNDTAHLHRVLAGPAGEELLRSVGKRGLVGLAFWDNGFKHLSANRPLLEPEDAAGLKFRTMPSRVLEAQFRAVGANPQVLPFAKVYSALQQGVVDACENPLSNFYTQKFYHVQTDLTLSAHGYLGYLVVTNRIFWRSLNKEQRTLIKDAMAEATVYGNKLALELDDKYLQKIKETGETRIHILSQEERKSWQEKMLSIYPTFYGVIGKDLIKAALSTR